jgi:hypothetical protein
MNSGYFYAYGPYGDHLAATAAVGATWAHVDMATRPLPETEDVAARCASLGLAVSYSIIPIVWVPGTPYTLHPQWRERFDYQRRWFDAFGPGLHSLYVGDEPYGNGIVPDDLERVLYHVRACGYRSMVVEDHRHIHPRPAADYYGVTCYTPATLAEAETIAAVEPTLNVMVGQAFNEAPHPIPGQWEQWGLWQRVYRHRPGAVLAWFLWPSYEQNGRGYIGTCKDNGVQASHAAMMKS